MRTMQRIKMGCSDSDWVDGYSSFRVASIEKRWVGGITRMVRQDMVQTMKRSPERRDYAARVGGRAAGLDAKVCHFLSSGEGGSSHGAV